MFCYDFLTSARRNIKSCWAFIAITPPSMLELKIFQRVKRLESISRKQELELNSFLLVFTWRLQDTFNKTKTDRGFFFVFKCQTKLNLRANRQTKKEGGVVRRRKIIKSSQQFHIFFSLSLNPLYIEETFPPGDRSFQPWRNWPLVCFLIKIRPRGLILAVETGWGHSQLVLSRPFTTPGPGGQRS